MKQSSILFFILFFYSCKSTIAIEGNVKNLPGNKVYLMLKGVDDRIMDSAIVIDNKFSFVKKVPKKYEPELVKLKVRSSKWVNQIDPLYLYDNKHEIDSLHYTRNVFYLEKGKTFVSGNYFDRFLLIQSGKENEIHFKSAATPSVWENDDIDSVSRLFAFEKIKQFIKENSSSFCYFDKISSSKIDFNSNELGELLPLFDRKILKSKRGKELKDYYSFKLKDTLPVSNFQMVDSNNYVSTVLDTSAQVTILDFWASWCIPCKTEIPALKRIYNRYKEKGLKVISISIDKSDDDWKEALKIENMGWSQFRIPENDRDKWIKYFDAYVIPETIILSKSFRKIKKVFGFDEQSEKTFESVLSKLLN